MNARELEIVAVRDECCGTDACPHTAIEHNDHTGWLKDGKLRCRTHDMEPLFECSLGFDTNLRCELVGLLDGHIHGPQCGHEMVPHGNHVDYLVGSRLHHVVDNAEQCCENGCLGEVVKSMVVDHGYVRVRKGGGKKSSSPQMPEEERMVAMTTSEIYAAGICCPSEVPVIYKILRGLPGVGDVEVTVLTKNVRVTHDASRTSPAVLVSALNGAGLQASLGKRDSASGSAAAALPPNIILSGILFAVSMIAYISSEVEWLKFVALVGVAAGCPLIVIRAFASLRRFILDINSLMLIGTLGAIALQEYHEAGAIVFLFGISQWLEDRCMGKARNAICGLKELQPDFATSANNSEAIPVGKIEVGDFLIVRPGDRVPVDGTVLSGTSSVDESLLTGESRPVAKKEGDDLLSGSVNSGSGSLKMEATSRVTDSTVAQLAKKVEETAMRRSPTERTVETFAKFYTPSVVLAAATVAVLPALVDSLDWTKWLKTSLVLLVTACPCALVISTPITTVCGISRAAQKSILIKGGSALETLSRLKAITFDKTGTLTEGHCNVVEVRTFAEMTVDELMNWAASVEVHSSHPLADAIVGSAAAKGNHHGSQAVSVENVAGRGLVGMRDDVRVMVGNWQLIKDQGIAFGSQMEGIEQEVSEKGQKACFVAFRQQLMGVIIVADRIRETAKPALEALRRRKLHLGLLTGDGPVSAAFVAESVGLAASSVHSSLLPEEKSGILRIYRQKFGPVGHVGDGINDSLALAAADVGVAMGVGGSTMAIEAADVALFSNEISSIAKAIEISQKVRFILRENIVFAISVKLTVIALAFHFKVRLWHAVIADVGSSLLVIMNSLRVLNFEKEKTERHHDQSLGNSCRFSAKHKAAETPYKPQGSSCCSSAKQGNSCCSSAKQETAETPQRAQGNSCCSKAKQETIEMSLLHQGPYSDAMEHTTTDSASVKPSKACCSQKSCASRKQANV